MLLKHHPFKESGIQIPFDEVLIGQYSLMERDRCFYTLNNILIKSPKHSSNGIFPRIGVNNQLGYE